MTHKMLVIYVVQVGYNYIQYDPLLVCEGLNLLYYVQPFYVYYITGPCVCVCVCVRACMYVMSVNGWVALQKHFLYCLMQSFHV